ncbi:MAG TPA: PEP-CTERM sorting domain-containing protein [Caulobacteraceae bacterium]|jgi:hypothetical protein|nr:PEP-CTERM sorting domain-containing protein [Caulobacteraceae bacterium]
MTSRFLSATAAAAALLFSGAANADVIFSNGATSAFNGAIMEPGFAAQIEVPVSSAANATSIELGVWVDGGATPVSVDWGFGQTAGSGALTDAGTANFADLVYYSTVNGFDIYDASITVSQALTAGTWYLTLQNGIASDASYVFLDVNPTGTQSTYVYSGGSLFATDDAGSFTVNGTISPAPEPGVWALMILGAGLIGGSFRLRRRAAYPSPIGRRWPKAG